MTGPASPEQRVRLEGFRSLHPDIAIGCEFNTWQARIPRQDGERFLARRDLRVLLDDAEEILAGGDPRADPG